ncbi:MAG: SMP-30/gluconolactonase/LRE family protein [Steroidobacteraceae bacterium]
MKTWLKRLGWTALAAAGLAAIIVLEFLRHGGQFKTLAPHFAGSCSSLPLAASAADIQLDRARGIAYLSYLDRRGLAEGKPVFGTVMLLDLNLAEPRPRPALVVDPPLFRPHGMSLYHAGDGSQRLFVINHPPGAEPSIEIFEQSATGAFRAVRTVRDPLLRSPEAIVAIGPDQFYVANASGAGSDFTRVTERLFRRGLSQLIHFDGRTMRTVATGLKSAAGMAMSPDGLQIYVSEASGQRLALFSRNAATGDLILLEQVPLGSAPDSVNVDADGSVWIAAHPKLLALGLHRRDPQRPAPTQIYRFLPQAKGGSRLTEVYLNDGRQISAGSVGTVFNQQLLIGSGTDLRILRCQLPL